MFRYHFVTCIIIKTKDIMKNENITPEMQAKLDEAERMASHFFLHEKYQLAIALSYQSN